MTVPVCLLSRRTLASSGVSNVMVASSNRPVPPIQIFFERRELDILLGVYSFMVAEGEWRDYAIDHLCDRAVFSVFGKSSRALYRIEKNPSLARRQGEYSVVCGNGLVRKRGRDLSRVLGIFGCSRLRLVG